MQSSPSTVAVIDVGSNSIKLLVAQSGSESGSVETVFAETIETRISAGISRELPSLTDDAMAAGLQTIQDLVHLAREYQPSAIRIVATSAVRDAINGMDFIDSVTEHTGIAMQVLTGTEEATLIGKGLACDPQIAGVHRFLQMDLGGGSLELIRFDHDQIETAISLQLGAVRLTERFIEDREAAVDLDTEQAIAAHVAEQIEQSAIEFPEGKEPMIATGGAVVVTRAILAAQQGVEIEAHSAMITLEEISRLKKELAALPLHERMATPHLPAARADIFPTALITIEQVLKQAAKNALTHSFYNLRYGIAAELLNM